MAGFLLIVVLFVFVKLIQQSDDTNSNYKTGAGNQKRNDDAEDMDPMFMNNLNFPFPNDMNFNGIPDHMEMHHIDSDHDGIPDFMDPNPFTPDDPGNIHNI